MASTPRAMVWESDLRKLGTRTRIPNREYEQLFPGLRVRDPSRLGSPALSACPLGNAPDPGHGDRRRDEQTRERARPVRSRHVRLCSRAGSSPVEVPIAPAIDVEGPRNTSSNEYGCLIFEVASTPRKGKNPFPLQCGAFRTCSSLTSMLETQRSHRRLAHVGRRYMPLQYRGTPHRKRQVGSTQRAFAKACSQSALRFVQPTVRPTTNAA